MKKILAAAGSALILLIPALSSAQTAPAVVKNIKTDFGATCNGVADDSRAFASFIAWAKRWQQTNSGLIELDLPSGSTCILYNPHWAGIKKLQIVGYGATLKGSFFLGVDGMRTGPDYRGKVQSVSAGSNSVTLLNAADAAKFKVGAWALMSGYDLQGLLNVDYGYPPNWAFMEYVQISSINGATVTFTAPLKYSYLSNWPSFNRWNGGPAQLNVLSDDWNIELEYKGLHISMPGQIYANGRTVTFRRNL
jgi:opacity protein-like surface antigen